jgi:hypothetical protein
MRDKSYVTMEQNVCIVCGKPFDTGALLLDRRLTNRFERYTVTGWGMCPEDAQKHADGFIALVECDEERSNARGKATMNPQDAYRTGTLCHIKAEAFRHVFNAPLPPKGVAFVGPGVIEKLTAMVRPEGAA